MQLAMIGLGRMGAGMVRRLMAAGHESVVWDVNRDAVAALVDDGAVGAASVEELVSKMDTPRSVWMMVPAGIVDTVIDTVSPHLSDGDVLIDGGNSMWRDDLRRSK
ncbi:MAG TPA: NAD(P)-binding domain-containing protein, partial [Phycisphaerales bacterium]|nr:NAD(P)-binding domain-containing protein [Phycisphaerales bacterium]